MFKYAKKLTIYNKSCAVIREVQNNVDEWCWMDEYK